MKNICMQGVLESLFPFSVSKKKRKEKKNSDIWDFFIKFLNLGYISLKISYFELEHDFDITMMFYRMLVLILVCMERGDHLVYYGTN